MYLLELNKFADQQVTTEEQRWLKFFKEGEHLDADRLPAWMQTPEMRQAMNTLKAFSERERAYDVYQARQDFLRQQGAIERERRSIQQALEETSAALEQKNAALAQERAAREAERQAKEAALGEVARLTAL
ncbi:PD-(D/E)XK nuclease family transposase, partial [uncultured Thiodictyon sp.]|uniref:PD-(D/E)XK nuclease family transposase n=1 Tax=uncultured Thiodictyon sp. TaxID=1846217 RepID=UPI0025E1F77B